jgi:ferredoxin-nitrate reductase
LHKEIKKRLSAFSSKITMVKTKLSAHTQKSTCCYCGVGCGVVINKQKNGSITLEGDKATR